MKGLTIIFAPISFSLREMKKSGKIARIGQISIRLNFEGNIHPNIIGTIKYIK